MAIACLLGTAGALGDAGSPASDSTLGPTAGLNTDGQHDHIWDTCVPTFLHYNIGFEIPLRVVDGFDEGLVEAYPWLADYVGLSVVDEWGAARLERADVEGWPMR